MASCIRKVVYSTPLSYRANSFKLSTPQCHTVLDSTQFKSSPSLPHSSRARRPAEPFASPGHRYQTLILIFKDLIKDLLNLVSLAKDIGSSAFTQFIHNFQSRISILNILKNLYKLMHTIWRPL